MRWGLGATVGGAAHAEEQVSGAVVRGEPWVARSDWGISKGVNWKGWSAEGFTDHVAAFARQVPVGSAKTRHTFRGGGGDLPGVAVGVGNVAGCLSLCLIRRWRVCFGVVKECQGGAEASAAVGESVKAVENVVKDESHLVAYFISKGLCALAMLTKMLMWKRWWNVISLHRLVEWRKEMDWWFLEVDPLMSQFGVGGSVVSGGGVVFRVVISSDGKKVCGTKGVISEDSMGVDGGVTL
ncbi:hypothetical protein Tco_0699785 [Tanacetum coccineum]